MARQTVMTRRAVAAATAGSTIEFYDFLLYGVAAALVFPEVFFPRQNPFTLQRRNAAMTTLVDRTPGLQAGAVVDDDEWPKVSFTAAR